MFCANFCCCEPDRALPALSARNDAVRSLFPEQRPDSRTMRKAQGPAHAPAKPIKTADATTTDAKTTAADVAGRRGGDWQHRVRSFYSLPSHRGVMAGGASRAVTVFAPTYFANPPKFPFCLLRQPRALQAPDFSSQWPATQLTSVGQQVVTRDR
jgi:hypothetical protein